MFFHSKIYLFILFVAKVQVWVMFSWKRSWELSYTAIIMNPHQILSTIYLHINYRI